MNIETLQPGDKVIISRTVGKDSIAEVARVTPKQVVIKTEFGSGFHFWKHNGHEVGSSSSWRSRYIVPATPELIERVLDRDQRSYAQEFLRTANYTGVSTKELMRMATELRTLGANPGNGS